MACVMSVVNIQVDALFKRCFEQNVRFNDGERK